MGKRIIQGGVRERDEHSNTKKQRFSNSQVQIIPNYLEIVALV